MHIYRCGLEQLKYMRLENMLKLEDESNMGLAREDLLLHFFSAS